MTIIVLLILAGVSIATLTGQGNILENAGNAREQTNEAVEDEKVKLAVSSARIVGQGNLLTQDLKDAIEEQFGTGKGDKLKGEGPWTYEGDIKSYTIDKQGTVSIPKVVEVIENGETKTLTEENVGDFLGKVVTNFKEEGSGTESLNDYTVSTKYRLYYVDFANKYEDGEGTIYLKAECTSGNNKALKLDETSTDETPGIRIKQLNPSLYAEGKTAPSSKNPNMQAVTWLLNEKNWSGLKNNLKDGGIKEGDINYIVGAPSLEMMMDSYNTHYGLTGDLPKAGDLIKGSPRTKLFYQYENGSTGYKVGPESSSDFANYTASYTVQTDDGANGIDTMYYPGSKNIYWLASPSANGINDVCIVSYGRGGFVSNNIYPVREYVFCPLVSLKSTVKLELGK